MTDESIDHRLIVPDTTVPRLYPEIGCQTPSIYHSPTWQHTDGDYVIALCEAVGLRLLPWQKLVVRNAFAVRGNRLAAFEVALIVARQNGKNVVLMAIILGHLFILGAEQIIFTSHRYKTTTSMYRDMRKLFEKSPYLMDMVDSMPIASGNHAIVLKSGARVDFLARAGGSGRGFSGDLVILDEALILSTELVADLKPTLSARPMPQLWYTSSAGLDHSDVLRSLHDRGVDEPEENPRLLLMEWSADLKEHRWDSVEAVAQANPSLGYFQDWEYIQAAELVSMPQNTYERERLGVWHDRVTEAAIGVDLWELTRATPEILVGNPPVRRSIAVESLRDPLELVVIAGATQLQDGTVLIDVIEARGGTAWLHDSLISLIRKNSPVAGVVVDSQSSIAAMAAVLEDAGIPITYATTTDVARGAQGLLDGLQAMDYVEGDDGEEIEVPAPTIFHGDDARMDDAAYTSVRRFMGKNGSRWTFGPHGEIPATPLQAAALAYRGLTMRNPATDKNTKKRSNKRGGRLL